MAHNKHKVAAGFNRQTLSNDIYTAIAAIDKNYGANTEASESYEDQYDALENYDDTDIDGENLDTPKETLMSLKQSEITLFLLYWQVIIMVLHLMIMIES